MADTRGIRAGRAYVEVGVNDQLTAGLRRAQRQLAAFGAGVRAMGQHMVLASAAAVTPLVAGGLAFAGFEQKMARVRALTGATGDDFARLATEAKRLGESTVFSAGQAAEAMGNLAQAGFRVDEILASVGPILDMAAAGQIEIGEAATITAQAMRSMGIAATDVSRVTDVLTKAMTTANTDLSMLGEAFKYVGAQGKVAGFSIEELTGAIQILSNAGIQGAMAGTTLRGMLQALTGTGAEQKLAELGVSIQDAAHNVRPLADILGDLEQALADMGSAQKLATLGELFPARAASGAATLIEAGGAQLRSLIGALQQAGGTAGRIASTQLNTLTGDVTILRSALEGLAIAVTEIYAGPLRAFVQLATQALGVTSQWVRAHRALVALAAASIAAFAGLGVTLVAAGVGMQVLGFVAGGLASALSLAAGVLGTVLSALSFMVTPLGAAGVAAAVLATNLLNLSATGGAAIRWLHDEIRRYAAVMMDIFDALAKAIAAGDLAAAARVLWTSLKLVWQSGIGTIQELWAQGWYAIQETALNAWADLKSGWANLSYWFWRAVIELTHFVEAQWADMAAGMKVVTATLTQWVADRWHDLWAVLDQDYDAALAKSVGAQELQGHLRQSEADRQQALARADRDVGAARDQLARERADSLAEIATAREAALAALERGTLEDIRKARAEYHQALAEWKQALQRARDLPGEPGAADVLKAKLEHAVQALAADLEVGGPAAAQRVMGTFNPAALNRLAAREPWDDIRATNRQIAQHTLTIADYMRLVQLGVRFL